MQAVLCYEERLAQAREDLRLEKGNYGGTLNQVKFWRCHVEYLEAKLKAMSMHAHVEKTGSDMTACNATREPSMQQRGGVLLAANSQKMKEDMGFVHEGVIDFPSKVVVVEDADSDDRTLATAHEVCVCDDGKGRDKHEEMPIIEVHGLVHDVNLARRVAEVHNNNPKFLSALSDEYRKCKGRWYTLVTVRM